MLRESAQIQLRDYELSPIRTTNTTSKLDWRAPRATIRMYQVLRQYDIVLPFSLLPSLRQLTTLLRY